MTPDEIRLATMKSIERQERAYKGAFIGGAAMELLFFMLFFGLMDMHNRTHVLLLISTVASYTIVVMGLIALGAMSNRNAHRVIKAIEATTAREPSV